MKHPKIAVIVYVIDPEGVRRFLMRHNKPFNGYEDEWTLVFGNIEVNEDELAAALREVKEEFGIENYTTVRALNYTSEYTGKRGLNTVSYYAIEVGTIDIPVILNEESIGYDWVPLAEAQKLMQHSDERRALSLV